MLVLTGFVEISAYWMLKFDVEKTEVHPLSDLAPSCWLLLSQHNIILNQIHCEIKVFTASITKKKWDNESNCCWEDRDVN